MGARIRAETVAARIIDLFAEWLTEVHGRMSKPELEMSSNPGIYSQAELLGIG